MIHQDQQDEKLVYLDWSPDEICELVQLPDEIDPAVTNISLESGVLELELYKTAKTQDWSLDVMEGSAAAQHSLQNWRRGGHNISRGHVLTGAVIAPPPLARTSHMSHTWTLFAGDTHLRKASFPRGLRSRVRHYHQRSSPAGALGPRAANLRTLGFVSFAKSAYERRTIWLCEQALKAMSFAAGRLSSTSTGIS